MEYPSYTEELFYDKAGNRTRRIASGVEELYQYDPRNRLTAFTKGGVTTMFQYDHAGNLLADDKARYSYDAFNRTEKVETFDGHIQLNRYDAEGLRYEMEENGNLVRFIFNQNREAVSEEDTSGLNRLIRGTELIAANSSADSARTYYHYASDEMGSTTHIVDETGAVQNRYEYDAWGNITAQEEAVPNRFKFTGQQLDQVTQQYYLRARFYNPIIARFTQEDTFRTDGLNLYAYCANNPVAYIDPSGNTYNCADARAKELIDKGVPKELAYRQAHAELLNQKLNDPNLSSTERQKIIDKITKTTDLSRVDNSTMNEAVRKIQEAQYKPESWFSKKNPMTLTIMTDGTAMLSKNNGVPGPKAREMANLMFGDNITFVRGGKKSNLQDHMTPNGQWNIGDHSNAHHSEARAVQAAINMGKQSALDGARQATWPLDPCNPPRDPGAIITADGRRLGGCSALQYMWNIQDTGARSS